MEPLFAQLIREVHGVEVPMPFPRLTYQEVIDRYGSDKPDLRYGMELADLNVVFAATGFNAFASVVTSGGRIQGIAAPGGAQLSRKELDQLVVETKGRGAAGLVWMVVEESGVRSPVEKHLSAEEIAGVLEATGAVAGDLVLIVADRADRVAVALDGLRRTMAARLELVREGEWRYLWVTEPPLFEWSDEDQRWAAQHHPFTAPLTDDLAPETAKARAYDIVLNGFELGSGSVRIHRPDLQRKVFEALGLSPEEIDEKFGHLINAFRYGVPPHAGIAPGIDRLVMVLTGKEAIRDVIAFPKAQSGADPLTGAPAPVSDEQLRDLGLRTVERPKKES
jgi:aspartyl-tRNA synthetase